VDPVPDPLLLRKSGSSQELWPLDHRGGHMPNHYSTKIDYVRAEAVMDNKCVSSWNIDLKTNVSEASSVSSIRIKPDEDHQEDT
jgi:hypothetical protein